MASDHGILQSYIDNISMGLLQGESDQDHGSEQIINKPYYAQYSAEDSNQPFPTLSE